MIGYIYLLPFLLSGPEMRRYRKNWLVIYSMMSLVGVGYFIVSASLHQFVTSSSSPEDSTVRHYCKPSLSADTGFLHTIVTALKCFTIISIIMSTLENMPNRLYRDKFLHRVIHYFHPITSKRKALEWLPNK